MKPPHSDAPPRPPPALTGAPSTSSGKSSAVTRSVDAVARQSTGRRARRRLAGAAVGGSISGVGVFGVAFRAEKQELRGQRQVEEETLVG